MLRTGKEKPFWQSENIKQVVYATGPLIFLGMSSAGLFFKGEADWFARFGSLIVAWALITLSVKREQYNKRLWIIERTRIVRNLNNQVKTREWMQSSLDLTFDIHASQIAQLSRRLGLGNPFGLHNDKAIKDFCDDVDRRFMEADWMKKSEQTHREFITLENDYHQQLEQLEGWSKLLWRLEFLLVLWGTIQWGYGDLLVNWWQGVR